MIDFQDLVFIHAYTETFQRENISLNPQVRKKNSLERLGVVEKLCSAYKNDQ